MKKTIRYTLIALLTGIVILSARAFLPGVEKPPLDAEFDLIARYQYSYYDLHGSAPTNLDHLPDNLRRLVDKSGSGITWDPAQQTIHYKYPKPFPMNRSLITDLTFGLIKNGPNTLGRSVAPDEIAHNAPIYKAEGLLPHL